MVETDQLKQSIIAKPSIVETDQLKQNLIAKPNSKFN